MEEIEIEEIEVKFEAMKQEETQNMNPRSRRQ
jgi:hypothetical protein